MNWDTIQQQWQSADAGPEPAPMADLLASARQREQELHRVVRRRDWLETGVALLMVPVFAVAAWFTLAKGLWVTGMASAFLTGCCLYIPWRLRQARALLPEPAASADMLAYLHAERQATEAQHALLHGILRWYLGPLGVGVVLFYFGARGWRVDTLYYTLGVVGLYGLLYVANRKAARVQILPRIEEIDRQIQEISSGSSTGDPA